jgi:uncharacterized protein (DUF779 family)
MTSTNRTEWCDVPRGTDVEVFRAGYGIWHHAQLIGVIAGRVSVFYAPSGAELHGFDPRNVRYPMSRVMS